jgi:Domain of unknown function (DUF4282)
MIEHMEEIPLTPGESVACASCGKPKSADAAYCVHCGAATHAATQQKAGSQRQSTTSSFVFGEHPASVTQRGLLASLLDVTFTSLVGTKLVRMLYVLAMIWIGLAALSYIVLAFRLSSAFGLVMLLVIAPFSSLLALGFTRVLLELCVSIFQVTANSNELVAQGRQDS